MDGEIKQFSCKIDVPLRLWDVKNNRASDKSVKAHKINLAVDKIGVEVNRRYQEPMQTDGYGAAARVKDAYLGIGVAETERNGTRGTQTGENRNTDRETERGGNGCGRGCKLNCVSKE